jgi:hypothetical protein
LPEEKCQKLQKNILHYDASKAVTTSPLDPKNVAKDIERGKKCMNTLVLLVTG